MGGGGLVGGGGFVGCGWGVGDKKRVAVGNSKVGCTCVGKPTSVGKKGVIPKGVTLGMKPSGVLVGRSGVAVTTIGPCVGVAVGITACGAVPQRKTPAQ